MADITIPGMFLSGDHASRPDANAVGDGSVYACSDHGKLYQSDGSTWSDWYTPLAAALGAWTSYTPALTAVTTNPTLGSSTLTGRYKLFDSKTLAVVVNLVVTTGGAWNAGSGEWKFSLPAGSTAGPLDQSIAVHVLDAGVGYFAGSAQVSAGASVITPVVISDDTGNRIMAHNKPVTWATGDRVMLSGTIQLA